MMHPDVEEREVFGLRFSRLGAEALAELVTRPEPPDGGLRRVYTANLDHVATMPRSPVFRSAYRSAFIATIDGTPVYLYARLRGLKTAGRVTGADLFPIIMEKLDATLHRPFFVASTEETARRLVDQLLARGFPRAGIGYAIPPFGFERDATATAALVQAIQAHKPTHLFMGVGSPKSEIWLYENREAIGPGYGFVFGAGLDYAAGTATRAPRILRAIGFEWAWRLALEPRRLMRRYLMQSWHFIGAVVADLRSVPGGGRE